jgi:hypothetical protein
VPERRRGVTERNGEAEEPNITVKLKVLSFIKIIKKVSEVIPFSSLSI